MKATDELIAQAVFRLNENTPRIEKCLAELTEEEIWLRPNASSNSVGNLVLHLCGNITQYIISSLGEQEDLRERDKEFETEGGYSRADLVEKLNSTLNEAIAVISKLGEEELLQVRSVHGFDFTGIGIVMHVVEHYSYHTGQIASWTKLLKDKDLGFYAGQDLNKKNKQPDIKVQ